MRRRPSSCRASFRFAAAFSISSRPTEDPVRIELFGDEVESIRRFDVATQRSLATLEATTSRFSSRLLRIAHISPLTCRRRTWFMLVEPDEIAGGGQLSGAAGSAAGVSCGADDAEGGLYVSLGHGVRSALGVDGDDCPFGDRIGRTLQRRHREGSRRARRGERGPGECSSSARPRPRSSGWSEAVCKH